jgi:hypothetical protein
MNPEPFYDIHINDININKLVNENFKHHVKYLIEKINRYIYGYFCTKLEDMIETFIQQVYFMFNNKFDYNDLKLKYSKIAYRQVFRGKLCPDDWSSGEKKPPFSQVLFILAYIINFGLNRIVIGKKIVYRKEYYWKPSIYNYNIDIIKDINMISCPKIKEKIIKLIY